jgi:hypothetical protein
MISLIFFLTLDHMIQVEFGNNPQNYIDIGQTEVGIKQRHRTAPLGQRDRQLTDRLVLPTPPLPLVMAIVRVRRGRESFFSITSLLRFAA